MLKTLRFAVVLPAASLLVAASIISAIAVQTWWRVQHWPREGGKIVVRNDRFRIEIPQEEVPLYIFRSAGFVAEKPISALDFPGSLLEILALGFKGQGAVWYPESIGLEAWRAVTLPFFALPFWWFAGRGFDSLAGTRRTGKAAMILSMVLSILFALLCLLMIFGMTQDVEDWQSYGWMGLGTAEWTLLFAAPAVAWFLQRGRERRLADPA